MAIKNGIDFSKIVTQPTSVFYLKMETRPKNQIFVDSRFSMDEISKPITTEECLKFYSAIGIEFNWLDRLVMPDQELYEKINANNVHKYIFKDDTTSIGFLELVVENDFVEVLYFGLFPNFVGRGLGKYFLQQSIQ